MKQDVTEPLLVIGNKNLSSWSLRPWLLMRHAGVPFRERLLPFETAGWRDLIIGLSPSGRVPALHVGDLVVWDSLAICEHVAETSPEARLWPDDPQVRAVARAVSCEMHAGFTAMRKDLPMDVTARYPRRTLSRETEDDVRRVQALWADCRARSAERAGEGGPFLFGRFSIADAMFAPVVWRFRTYDVPIAEGARAYYETMLAMPAMREWEADARAEVSALAGKAPAGPPDPRSAQHSFAVIFSSQRVSDGPAGAAAYEAAAQEMVELAARQPGFLAVESARGTDGFGITVSYWESLEAIRAWKELPSHAAAQARGKKSFYERYEVRVATVERGYKYP